MKQYYIYNGQTLKYISSNYYEMQPLNSTDVPPRVDIAYAKWNGLIWIDGRTESELNDMRLNEETNNYIKRINDGIQQVAQFSAGLRLQKMAGVITEVGHKAIDDALIPIRTEILAGQWISGKDKLIELGSSLIGVDLYNYIMSKIDSYIADNY